MKIEMKKVGAWFDDRLALTPIFKYMTKKEIPQHEHSIWYYTGSSILLFLAIQIVTGIMLALYYKPTLEGANDSVARIMTEMPLGWLVRSIHSWSATFMIAFVMIHLLAIWFTKSYRKPRESTWMTGMMLLVVSMVFGFTGYLLPWDDLSLSATKVGTNIPNAIPVVGKWVTQFLRGGDDVTGDTLTRFFLFHVCILPLVIFAVLAVHILLVQKEGMSVPLKDEIAKKKVPSLPFWPNFILREVIIWLVLLGTLLTIALVFAPSLGPSADMMAPAPAGVKPEWYFLFLFQTLKIFPANIGPVTGEFVAVVLILLTVVAIFFLPFLDNKPGGKKGKFWNYAGVLGVIYAVVFSIWSLL
jgi:quinol-cytochrome oxidoreductase complex cytochrome b subunit